MLDLDRDRLRPAVGPRLVHRLHAHPRGVVAEARVAHLALLHEHVERLHRLVDRRVHILEVAPEEIDVVGLQAAQRVLDRAEHRLSRRAAAVRIALPHVSAELRGDDHAVALAAARAGREVVAEDRLAVTLRVHVGGVDEVAAALEVARQNRVRGLDIGADAPFKAEGHRAEAERRDAQARAA